jgi:hypothetical protein
MPQSFGICELYCWAVHDPERPWRTGHEVEDCLQAHLDAGITDIIWKLGRSVIEFHTDLPNATLFTGQGREEPYIAQIGEMFGERCCLRVALDFAQANGMILYGRLGMNRHYAPTAHGGSLTSDWAKAHPEFCEVGKEGDADTSRLCYAFDEVRQERIDLLIEAARIGVHGLQLDFCRQPPMCRYHPALVDGFTAETGTDPHDIDPWEGSAFRDWITCRAQFVTQMMRELHSELEDIRHQTGRHIPVQARITDNGLDVNMMAGVDLRTWCAEGLIQEIAVSSLNWLQEFGEHDLRPYTQLGLEHGIRVLGGVNSLAIQRVSGALPSEREINPVRMAQRALDQYAAGADAMTLYQSDFAVECEHLKSILSILGDPDALHAYATDAGTLARWPMTYRNSTYGLDNHSHPRFRLYGGPVGV